MAEREGGNCPAAALESMTTPMIVCVSHPPRLHCDKHPGADLQPDAKPNAKGTGTGNPSCDTNLQQNPDWASDIGKRQQARNNNVQKKEPNIFCANKCGKANSSLRPLAL